MPVRPPGPATQIVPGIQFKFPEIQLQFASKKSPKVLGLPSEHGPPTLQDGATGRQLQFTSNNPFDTDGVLHGPPGVQAGVVVLSHISPMPSPSESC